MTDIVENFNFIKDIYFWNNSKRNIIGLYYNKIQPYNPSSDPFKKIIRKEPINEEVKNKCKSKWEECTNFNICNEMFNLNQESLYNNLNMNSEQLDFYIKNQNNIKFLELKDCIMPLLKKKVIQEEVALPQEVLPQEVLPQEVLPQEVLPQEVLPQEVLPQEVVKPLSRKFPCNIIYKLPIIGKGICSKKDNSNFIILGVILFIILIVILFYIFSSKKNVLSLSEIKQIKLDKALQVKYP